MKIEVPDLTPQECGDIAITAAEGGIGYWARIDSYDYTRWCPDVFEGCIAVADDFVFYAIKYENPTGDTPPFLTADITPAVIRKGIELILAGGIRRDLVAQTLQLVRDGEAGGVDADVADCAVQLGLLGEVSFG